MKSILTLLVLLCTVSAFAQPASSPEARQFDFWVGEWDVFTRADGKLAGHNRIELAHGGRVLIENYSTPRQFSGTSINAYDAATRRWHQCWMDNGGGVLDIYGSIVDGNMVMTGETMMANGAKQLERITWFPSPDGTIRQHWEQSTDGGKTWTTAFDGIYRRRSPAA